MEFGIFKKIFVDCKPMSFRYLHIDSRHLQHPGDKTSNFDVKLLTPIENATHVELVSFSTSHDFINVDARNNTLRLLFKRDQVSTVFKIDISITPGFYTHAELVSAITSAWRASSTYSSTATDSGTGTEFEIMAPQVLSSGVFVDQTTYTCKLNISALANGKTTLIIKTNDASSQTADLKYGFVAFSQEAYRAHLFHDSIIHRLGFEKTQVWFGQQVIVNDNQVFRTDIASNQIFMTRTHKIHGTSSPGSSVQGYESMDEAQFVTFMYLLNVASKILKTGQKIAWETHEAIILTSSLVHDFESTDAEYLDSGCTQHKNILAIIPITVNRASWIHYRSTESENVHILTNPLIRNLKIGMMNSHSRTHFDLYGCPDFTCTLKIHLKDDKGEPNRAMMESIRRGMREFAVE
jgi:hypothetical protein